jgi:hypothetical protein
MGDGSSVEKLDVHVPWLVVDSVEFELEVVSAPGVVDVRLSTVDWVEVTI